MYTSRLCNTRLQQQPISILSKSEDTYDEDKDLTPTPTAVSATCRKEAPTAAVSETCSKDALTTADATTSTNEAPPVVTIMSCKATLIKPMKRETERVPLWAAKRKPHFLQLDHNRMCYAHCDLYTFPEDEEICMLEFEEYDQKQEQANRLEEMMKLGHERQQEKIKRLIAALSFSDY